MRNDFTLEKQLKIFTMQNLLLETDLINLEKSGIEIGHIRSLQKQELVDTDLFESDILKQARRMADFYVLYYSIENSIRRLISETLSEKYGGNWWELRAPDGVKKNVKELQEKEKDSPLTIRSDDPLTYTNFGELIDIFNHNWDDFSDIIRSKKAMQETLSKLNQLRGIVAHSCELKEDEITRFELLIKDWLRIQT